VIDSDIVARVRLYTTAEGGRDGPTPVGSFGCLFVLGSSLFDCRLLLAETGPLRPGSTAVVPIRFLHPEIVRDHLRVGSRFFLRESRAIAEGEVQSLSFD